MSKLPLQRFLSEATEPIVSDGGITTSLYDLGYYINRSFEELSILHPESVREVVLGFKRAGANFLTTNTFAATVPKLSEYNIQDKIKEIIQASVGITVSVAGEDSYTLGAMGPVGVVLEPLGPTSFEQAVEWFGNTAKWMDEMGVDGFTLLSFHDLRELEAAITGIQKVSQKPILAHISVQESMRTSFGSSLSDFVTLTESLDVAVVGISGEVGPSDMLTALESLRQITTKPISVLPNAGFPRFVNDQYIYLCNPDYMGKFAKRFVQAGAQIIGGHSGVNHHHIRAIANSVKMIKNVGTPGNVTSPKERNEHTKVTTVQLSERSQLGAKLASRERIFTVEINPPKGVDFDKFFEHCARLVDGQIDFVNIPDGARAMARVGSLHLASYIQNKFKIEAIPHFTARDRNLLGLQADFLGSYVNGIRNLLLVTGDPPKLGNCPGASGVYDVDAIGLTHIAHHLNNGTDLGGSKFGKPTSFVIGVALNPTAINAELEISRFRYKVQAGADYAITQPIYDLPAYQKFFDQYGKPEIPIIMGIWPLVSLKNAEFLKFEVPGVVVPDWAVTEMQKAGDKKEEAIKRGMEIALKTMDEAKDWVAGFQISAPFNNVDIATQLINQIRKN